MFAPESGRLMLVIHGAHNMGVTAIAGTRNCKRIVSGGGTGMVSEKQHRKPVNPNKPGFLCVFQVRVWEVQPKGHRLLETMKEHKGTVTCIRIKSDDKECVSASSDGVCVIWDIV